MTHPMLVHVPLGLAAVLPLVGLWLLWFARNQPVARSIWLLLLLLQLATSAGAIVALRSGEAEEDRVEHLLPHDALESHEERAEAFAYASLLTLVGITGMTIISTRLRKDGLLASLTLLLFLVQAGLGVATGKAGGELVWTHGAKLLQSGSVSTLPVDAHEDE